MFGKGFLGQQRRCQYGHDGTQVTEEAEGGIYQGGDTQDVALRHTAGVPRNQDGADRRTILARSTEQTRLQPIAFVGRAEHGGGKDDGQVLVG